MSGDPLTVGTAATIVTLLALSTAQHGMIRGPVGALRLQAAAGVRLAAWIVRRRLPVGLVQLSVIAAVLLSIPVESLRLLAGAGVVALGTVYFVHTCSILRRRRDLPCGCMTDSAEPATKYSLIPSGVLVVCGALLATASAVESAIDTSHATLTMIAIVGAQLGLGAAVSTLARSTDSELNMSERAT